MFVAGKQQQGTSVKRATLADQIVDYVRDGISQNALQPGQRLTIQGLAQELNVSMTPVREAIKTLHAMRLVESETNRGVTIAQPDARETLDLLRVYSRLEAFAGELLAETHTAADIEDLRKIAQRITQAVTQSDRLEYFHANQDFHLRLVAMAGNASLAEIHQNLNARLYPFRFRGISSSDHGWMELADEHQLIIDAITAGDVRRSAELLEFHSRGARAALEAVIADR